MSYVFVMEAGGMSSVSVVEAGWNKLNISVVKAGWNELCFCGGGRVKGALFLWWRRVE
jgi:hypothetical protein